MQQEYYIADKCLLENGLSKDEATYPGGIVFIVDKPYGWTSADVVRKVKFSIQRWFGKKNIKVGHAGTLDPLATGVLLVCAGKATRMAETLQSQKKEYIAEITFGATTPSFDLEKEIDNLYPYDHITLEMVENALKKFMGTIEQMPPLFSAKLVEGKRAYDIARSGGDAQLKPSTVTIYKTCIISWENPILRVAIECSKGTYVRSFARDLGFECNSGAHLTGLVRSASGAFTVDNAISLDKLKLFFD